MILQTDPNWLPERRGRLTASRFGDACAFTKKGPEAAERKKYKIELVAERMADYAVSRYVSSSMQRGLDNEPGARMNYEIRTGHICGPAVLIHHPRIDLFSATPDAPLQDDGDGLAEFKVPEVNNYIAWVAAGVIPEEHIPQLVAQIAVTGREWVDFCAFCPELPEPRNLFIRRYTPTAEEIANCEAAAIQFLAEVEKMFEIVTTADYA